MWCMLSQVTGMLGRGSGASCHTIEADVAAHRSAWGQLRRWRPRRPRCGRSGAGCCRGAPRCGPRGLRRAQR